MDPHVARPEPGPRDVCDEGTGMNPDLIFDVGMNNGDDTDFDLAKGFRVVAIEANPDQRAAATYDSAARFERPPSNRK